MSNWTSSNTLPAVETLESRLLMSSVALAPTVMANASALNLPAAGQTVLDATIYNAGGAKLYTFDAKATGTLTLAMTGQDGLDSQLGIFNSLGQRIAWNNNATTATLDSQVTFQVANGQSYFIRASSMGQTQGRYRLSFNQRAADDYGNTLSSAKNWGLDSTGAGSISGNINYVGDADVLGFTAMQTGTMQLTMTPKSGSSVVGQMTVYTAAGVQVVVDQNTDGTADAQVSVDVVAGTRYYVMLQGAAGTTGQYVVAASTTVPAPDPTPDPTPNPDPTVPTPQVVVTAQTVQTNSGVELLVMGTDQADTITIASISDGLQVITSAGSQNFTGNFDSVVIYGFDGNDTIRVMHSVTASALIYGGAGNDSLYDAGTGAASLLGQDGDDLLVSVGGGKATLTGGNGTDSFWLDSADSVADASTAENGIKSVHKIAAFYQPYTTSTVSLDIDGQNLADPAVGNYANGWHNYASNPLFLDGPQYNDIRQGNLGDCYLLASLASIADTNPAEIQQLIAPMGDGTYAVRFNRNGKEVYLRLDADLPTYGAGLTYARLSPTGETWVALVEKAYAYFRYGDNSYASIEGGWMGTVYTEVSGANYAYRWLDTTSTDAYNYIATQLAAGHAVSAASYSNATGPIVGNHAYEVKSVDNGYVTVYNPWGVDGTNYDSNSSDGLLRLSLNTFLAKFTAIAVNMG